MLRKLHIKNFLLIDDLEIPFNDGFTVISGETGAGKSMIINALSFVLGAKSDLSLIRQGAESAQVEAYFDEVQKEYLEEAGLDLSDELFIKRELSINGKSRLFINNSLCAVQGLKKIAPSLIQFSSRDSDIDLEDEMAPLNIVDKFANSVKELNRFKDSYRKEQELLFWLNDWQAKKEERQKEQLRLEEEIAEITTSNLKEGEVEELQKSLTVLQSAEELQAGCGAILETLQDGPVSILGQARSQKNLFSKIAQIDDKLQPLESAFQSSLAELQEVAFQLERYGATLSSDPQRIIEIEERLNHIDTLKRRFGQTPDKIRQCLPEKKEALQKLLNQDEEAAQIQSELQTVTQETNTKAAKLSEKRKESLEALSKAVTKEIQALNMEQAKFSPLLKEVPRTTLGDESIEFHVSLNQGEKAGNVAHIASQGELARIKLALHLVLKDHLQKGRTLFFDEIDSHVGGLAAKCVAQKLALLGKTAQVIAITHFPQVAMCATTHLHIYKFEKAGRTYSQVKILDSREREKELLRMMGGGENLLEVVETQSKKS